MSAIGETFSIGDVAARFHLTEAQVLNRCRRSLNPWPHLRPNERDASTWCFAEQDIADIEARISHNRLPVDSWGRERRRSA